MFKKHKVKVVNADFYLSKENVEPVGKVSGTFYILNNEPINGKYKVSSLKPNLFPFLDYEKGYIMACDIDGLTKKNRF